MRIAISGRSPRDADPARRSELLIEFDDRCGTEAWQAKLRRYEHFLTGWSTRLHRYEHDAFVPVVVFVCRDRAQARKCARQADGLLKASQAYAGEHPSLWRYLARQRTLFAAERDAHEGVLGAYALSPVPPTLRHERGDASRADSSSVKVVAIDRLPDAS